MAYRTWLAIRILIAAVVAVSAYVLYQTHEYPGIFGFGMAFYIVISAITAGPQTYQFRLPDNAAQMDASEVVFMTRPASIFGCQIWPEKRIAGPKGMKVGPGKTIEIKYSPGEKPAVEVF
jgi:hypothetical protein